MHGLWPALLGGPACGFGARNAFHERRGDPSLLEVRVARGCCRCSGIDVLMPSITVISSARRMRAIASVARRDRAS